jgi:hypothetical protein
MDSKGVLYIATGTEYIEEARLSVRSLKRHSPDLPATLLTDEEIDPGHFDDVRVLSGFDHDFGDSIISPDALPYDRTLFLDSDTFVCEDLTDSFRILDRFDIAAAHNPGSRTADVRGGYAARDTPETFPQYNTGVLYLRNSEKITEFLRNWRSVYDEHKTETTSGLNQPSFREALYHCDLNMATLPPEYNLRVRYAGCVGFAVGKAKIIHGRHPAGLPRVANRLNDTHEMRVFTLKRWPIQVLDKHPGISYLAVTLLTEDSKHYTYRGRLINSMRGRGVRDTLDRIVRDIKSILQ